MAQRNGKGISRKRRFKNMSKELCFNVNKHRFKKEKGIRHRRCHICLVPEGNENKMRKKRFCSSCGADLQGIIDYKTGKMKWSRIREIAKRRKEKAVKREDLLIKK